MSPWALAAYEPFGHRHRLAAMLLLVLFPEKDKEVGLDEDKVSAWVKVVKFHHALCCWTLPI